MAFMSPENYGEKFITKRGGSFRVDLPGELRLDEIGNFWKTEGKFFVIKSGDLIELVHDSYPNRRALKIAGVEVEGGSIRRKGIEPGIYKITRWYQQRIVVGK
jgi:hypothetical protein